MPAGLWPAASAAANLDLSARATGFCACGASATAAAPNRYRPQWDELRFGHTGVTATTSASSPSPPPGSWGRR